MRLLQEEGRARALSTAGVVLSLGVEDCLCLLCSGPTLVQKTVRRDVATRDHGSFVARETVRVCVARCRHPSGELATRRSEALAEQVASGATYGYDLEVHVGLERFLHHRQREEIRASLQEKFGISLSSGQVSNLANRFLNHLEELHISRAPALREALARDGGYPLHIDATGEDGRGTLFVAYAGWRKWVLGAWKLTTERADKVLPCLREIVARFGSPCAIMRDLGRAMTQAAIDLVRETDDYIQILGCHLHFLKDIGKDLMEPAYRQMRELFRRDRVNAGLRALARDLGRQLGEQIPDLRVAITVRIENSSDHTLPAGLEGLATVRALAQWALDYHSDGDSRGFPFDRPYLDGYKRCLVVRRAVDAFMRKPPEDPAVRRAARRLASILDPVLSDKLFAQVAATLKSRGALFDELRAVLRILPAGAHGVTEKAEALSPQEGAKELKGIQQSLDALVASLRKRRPERGPAQEVREAIDLVLDHIDRHGPTLWGHEIRLPESIGGGVRLVDRTNNLLEGYFHEVKHAERRRSGRKCLTRDFECLPAAAALTANLNKPDYVELLCGSPDRLPAAFAKLDADRRASRLATVPGGAPPTASSKSEVATASLPNLDRPVVRATSMRNFIEAAARSRAPRNAASAAK